jgi:hypothetical protein
MVLLRRYVFIARISFVMISTTLLLGVGQFSIQASPVLGIYTVPTIEDQNPNEACKNPDISTYSSRYISGFGQDDQFTIFFENRDDSYTISFLTTTTGPSGFPSTPAATNIADTHFTVKDWPYIYDGSPYAYREWGADGNNPDHNFYVSNDLITWTLVSESFTIPNDPTFSTARGFVYYGFHDVILINGTYYAWAEANSGETMFVRSALGGDVWEAFDRVGGNQDTDGLLLTPGAGISPTPTGSFFELGNDEGYGKIYVPGDDTGIYLAVNTIAKPSQDPAVLEANFINPANWTWHDGSTGRLTPAHALLYTTANHDYREVWMVHQSNPNNAWVLMYTANINGKKSLMNATSPNVCDPGLACMIFPKTVK